MERAFFPGTRVFAFDSRLYRDDVSTPLSQTMRPATILRWYGKRSLYGWRDPSLVDLLFDHDERESRGHFTAQLGERSCPS